MSKIIKWFLVTTTAVLLTACGGSGGGADTCTGGDAISHLGTDYCEVTSPYTSKVWLDRNLGATMVCDKSRDDVGEGFTDATYTASQQNCFGDYYQWGRDADGHENSTDSTAVLADDVNNAGTKFITNPSLPYDWASVDATDATGATRTANWSKTDGSSVCPIGFRVPTIVELRAELSDTGTSAEIQNREDAYNSFLKLPPSGFRSNDSASMNNVGSWGYVWASSVVGAYSLAVYFYSDGAGWGGDGRASGFSVRCLRD